MERLSTALQPGTVPLLHLAPGQALVTVSFSEASHELSRNLLSADAQRDWEGGQR